MACWSAYPDDPTGTAAALTRMIAEGELRRCWGQAALGIGRREVCTWQERTGREVSPVEERPGLDGRHGSAEA